MALLQTKLSIPFTQPSLITRERLSQKLDELYAYKLVLVSAPAGFGKTTLIASYVSRKIVAEKFDAAWLSLGESDNDPVRFLDYLLEALKNAGIISRVDDTAVATTSPDHIMTDLVNDITTNLTTQSPEHLLLVLDDYHHINNLLIHQTITFLLEHMPPQMHIILVTRADPPLQLARWRAHNQILELRQQDLHFSQAETIDFLNRGMGLNLSTSAAEDLNNRTEGWIAGLQMAGISLQKASDSTEFVQSFSGSNRYVLDYLMEEVLSLQSEEVYQFLLQTAILDRLSVPLCDFLLAESNTSHSEPILQYLERSNLFIIPLDQERQWYRYHRLFADLLRQRLEQTQPTQIPILHERASTWFEANGNIEEAIKHALQAKSYAVAVRLIDTHAEAKLMRSELVTVTRWLEALPKAELAQRPSLSFYYAWAMIMERRPEAEVTQLLRHVSTEGSPGELALVHSLLALVRGDSTTAIALAQQALAQLAHDHAFFRGVASWILGLSLLFQGARETGVAAMEQAVQISQQVGNMSIATMALGRLANQAKRDGNLHHAKRIYLQSLVLATDDNERSLPIAGESHFGLARIYFEWNQLETAINHIETGLALTEHWRAISAIPGYVWLARIEQAQGRPSKANRALQHAHQLAFQTKGSSLDDTAVAMVAALLQLQQGNLDAVEAWCVDRNIPIQVDTVVLRKHADVIEGHLRKYEFTILARLRLAQNRPDAAVKILLPLLENSQFLQRKDLQLESHLLIAVAHQKRGNIPLADQHMQQALAIGESGGFIRLFVDAGVEMAVLLNRQKSTDVKRLTYLHNLLVACGQIPPAAEQLPRSTPAPMQLIEPLSKRELEVLTLIATGLSNREIAQELILSLPTIKWHTSNIYSKLGVGNRTTAVARARELNILPK